MRSRSSVPLGCLGLWESDKQVARIRLLDRTRWSTRLHTDILDKHSLPVPRPRNQCPDNEQHPQHHSQHRLQQQPHQQATAKSAASARSNDSSAVGSIITLGLPEAKCSLLGCQSWVQGTHCLTALMIRGWDVHFNTDIDAI